MLKQFVFLGTVAVAAGGCLIETEVDGVSGTNDKPSFEQFERETYKEPWEDGVYVVNGDTAIENVKKLREFYDSIYNDGALIVHRAGGGDAKWSDSQKVNLTYCISDSFGSRKSTMIAAMNEATTNGWEEAANVNFVHVTSQDSNCTASNNNVVFDVRPVSGQPYLARAFFPNNGRSSRNVLIDTSAFSTSWPLAAIVAHELGHALGFRHEHTRPEAGTCYEDNNWRALTPYDSVSIMHYPQCNGGSSQLAFSTRDYQGAAALYGSPSGDPDPDPDPDPTPDPDPDPDPTDGTPRSGSASGSLYRGQEHNYQPLRVLPGSPLVVQITGTGDADLYVRFGAAPTVYQFHCRPYLNGSSETCDLDVPSGQTQAYIMVRGYRSSTYNLQASWVEP